MNFKLNSKKAVLFFSSLCILAFTNVGGKAFASCSTSPDPIMIEQFKTRVFRVLFSGKIEEPGALKDIIKTEKIDPNAKFDRFPILGDYVSQSPTQNVREVLKTLQDLGADIKAVQAERNQAHIMHLAVAPISRPHNTEIISILHDLGADIEARNIKGETPLYIAIQLKHFDIAEALLKLGANPEAQTLSGSTPISLATSLGKLDEIKNHIKGL